MLKIPEISSSDRSINSRLYEKFLETSAFKRISSKDLQYKLENLEACQKREQILQNLFLEKKSLLKTLKRQLLEREEKQEKQEKQEKEEEGKEDGNANTSVSNWLNRGSDSQFFESHREKHQKKLCAQEHSEKQKKILRLTRCIDVLREFNYKALLREQSDQKNSECFLLKDVSNTVEEGFKHIHQIAKLEEKIIVVEIQNSEQTDQMAKLEEKIAVLKIENSEQTDQMAKLEEKIAVLKIENSEQTDQMAKLEKKRAILEIKNSEQEREIVTLDKTNEALRHAVVYQLQSRMSSYNPPYYTPAYPPPVFFRAPPSAPVRNKQTFLTSVNLR